MVARQAAKKATGIDAVLEERAKTHGNFTDNSIVAQGIKDVLHASVNWEELTPMHKEALEMIAHKMGRICGGNPNEPDHWADIQGYAKLSERYTA